MFDAFVKSMNAKLPPALSAILVSIIRLRRTRNYAARPAPAGLHLVNAFYQM
jgi:hypothetical protein